MITQWYTIKDGKYPVSNMIGKHALGDNHTLMHLKSLIDIGNTPKIMDYTLKRIDNLNSWCDHTDETTIKYIGDDYNDADINVLIFHFRNQEDDVFRIQGMAPLDQLPDYAIDFLRAHPDCLIVMFDHQEAKCITNEGWAILPSLIRQRGQYALTNQFVWLHCGANNIDMMDETFYEIPGWLTIKSSNHWLQHQYHDSMVKDKCDSVVDAMTYNSGSVPFLFYAGRYRLSRHCLIHELLNSSSIDRSQIYMKINKSSMQLPVKSRLRQHVNVEMARGNAFTNDYTAEYLQKLDGLHDRLPIDTFPEYLQEMPTDQYYEQPYSYHPDPAHYGAIFVELISETKAERLGQYKHLNIITEKVGKPMFACRPFLVHANAGYFDELHRMGFMTFDRWWDESYNDAGLTAKESAQKIILIMEEITTWNNRKRVQVFNEMRDVLEYNRKHLEWFCNDAPREMLEALKNI